MSHGVKGRFKTYQNYKYRRRTTNHSRDKLDFRILAFCQRRPLWIIQGQRSSYHAIWFDLLTSIGIMLLRRIVSEIQPLKVLEFEFPILTLRSKVKVNLEWSYVVSY